MNIKKALNKILLCSASAAIALSSYAYAFPASGGLVNNTASPKPEAEAMSKIETAPQISIYVDGKKIIFDTDVRLENDRTIVPMRAIFEALGTEVTWDEVNLSAIATTYGATVAITADEDVMKKNAGEIKLDTPARMFDDRMFVPVRAISEAFDCYVSWDEPSQTVLIDSRPNPMHDTSVTDESEYPNYNGIFNDISIFDKEQTEFFGMELLNISDEQGSQYADIINSFADAAHGANIYNLIAPTAAEFYAASDYKTHYTPAIHKIYSQLNDSVTGINAVGELMKHLDENIYFRTDHHWTQRGAYYAYKAFAEAIGEQIDPCDTFDKQVIDDYNGSLIRFTAGTPGADLLKMSPDILELYNPKVSYRGRSYNDMEMTDYIKPMNIISPQYNNYSCFIEGDYPLVVFDTDIKNGRKLVIVKESYGNTFSTWAVNNFETVYVVDYRKFNTYGGHSEYSAPFKISEFKELTGFTDLIILSYPISVTGSFEVDALTKMAQ